MTKPRLALFSLVPVMGVFAAVADEPSASLTSATLFGAAMAAGGALSFNQLLERRVDRLMTRTRHRPLPSGQMAPALALVWSLGLSAGGVAVLATWVNREAAIIAGATIAIYSFAYTLLKRHTRWATEVGSISGALPPVLGAAAGGDLFHPAGIALATVLLFWQMPHFYAIGWRYRSDYRSAGFPLLPAADLDGRKTTRWSFGYTLCTLAASLLPWLLGWFGWIYLLGATTGGLLFLREAWLFLKSDDADARSIAARALFHASLIHISLLVAAIVIERLLSLSSS